MATRVAAAAAQRGAESRRTIIGLAACGALGVAALFLLDGAAGSNGDVKSRAGLVLAAAGIIVAITGIAILLLVRRHVAAVPALRVEAHAGPVSLDAVLAQIPLGLCIFDARQHLVAVSPRFAEIFAIPASWLRPGILYGELLELSRGAKGGHSPLPAWHRIGESDSLPQILDNGAVIEIACRALGGGSRALFVSDVSERQRQAEALREARIECEIAQKAKASFLANMSHELRTPLNAIIGFTDLMAAEMFGPLGHANYRDYVADIQLSSRHLLEIITDILQMAKIEAGGVVLHEENVDLRAAAQFCRRLVRGRAAANVGIALELPADLPALWADERLVKQMLLNLLSNAVKFTLANGHITVSAACDEAGRLILEVRDTGIGIAPEDIEKALTPFGQIDNAYTRRHNGTGLGLPIVRSYAALHGATFTIESAPGQGTCVRIGFPAARVRALSPKENGGP